MKVTSWSTIGAVVAALAGIIGTILTPVFGTSLSTAVSAVLQALSGLLVLIPTFHVSSVAAANAKTKAAYAAEREHLAAMKQAGLLPAASALAA